MTSAFSSQPCAARTSQPVSQVPFWEPWIRVEVVSGTPPDHRASCVRSFDPHETSVVLGGENAIGQPLAQGGGQDATETASVVDLPLIVTIDLLVDVAVQVNRRDGDVGSLEGAFQQAPEVLDAVGVDATDDVLVDVVDGGVEVVQGEPAVGGGGVSVNVGVEFNIAANGSLKGVIVSVGDDASPDLTATLQKALHNRLTHWAAATYSFRPLPLMHVLGLAAYEGFVNFYLARQLSEGSSLHRQSDTVEHEPCRLLGDFQGPRKLTTADAILGVRNAPDGHEPLVQSEGAVLEDSPNLHAELLPAVLCFALEKRPGDDNPHFIAAALGAGDFSVRVLSPEHRLETDFRVGEVTDGGQ